MKKHSPQVQHETVGNTGESCRTYFTSLQMYSKISSFALVSADRKLLHTFFYILPILLLLNRLFKIIIIISNLYKDLQYDSKMKLCSTDRQLQNYFYFVLPVHSIAFPWQHLFSDICQSKSEVYSSCLDLLSAVSRRFCACYLQDEMKHSILTIPSLMLQSGKQHLYYVFPVFF